MDEEREAERDSSRVLPSREGRLPSDTEVVEGNLGMERYRSIIACSRDLPSQFFKVPLYPAFPLLQSAPQRQLKEELAWACSSGEYMPSGQESCGGRNRRQLLTLWPLSGTPSAFSL